LSDLGIEDGLNAEVGKERRWEDRKVRRWEKAGLSDEDCGLSVPELGILFNNKPQTTDSERRVRFTSLHEYCECG
jgi:hypothetical protein